MTVLRVARRSELGLARARVCHPLRMVGRKHGQRGCSTVGLLYSVRSEHVPQVFDSADHLCENLVSVSHFSCNDGGSCRWRGQGIGPCLLHASQRGATASLTLPHATEALREYSEMAILSSTRPSAKLSSPWAMAPMKTTMF